MPRRLLSIHDLTLFEFHALLDSAGALKNKPGRFQGRLAGRTLALVFKKADDPRRISFELGVRHLGGAAVYLEHDPGQGGEGAGPGPLVKILERWVDGLVLHGFAHTQIAKLPHESGIPLINSGTDLVSPCLALGTLFTIREAHKDLGSLGLAYVGPADGLCHSLILAAAKAGTRVAVAVPPGQILSEEILRWAGEDGAHTGFKLDLTQDPAEAVSGADAVVMSPPDRIDAGLLARAGADALVIPGIPSSGGWPLLPETVNDHPVLGLAQAENMLHIQNAIVLSLLEN